MTITVSGGTGQVSANFGAAAYEGVSIVSPDNTPLYDFHIYDSENHLQVAALAIDSQKTAIKENFILYGTCTVRIDNAADDGSYTVKLVPRP